MAAAISLLVFITCLLATIWQTVRHGHVPTSTARCPRKLGILWSDILVRTPLTSRLWRVTVGEIVSASFCPIIPHGQLQLPRGLMPSHSPSRWGITFTFIRLLSWSGHSSFACRPYQRQKTALEKQLSAFLSSISPPKTISSCTPDDTIKFLIYKDKSGRTAIHAPACSGAMCLCSRRLAAGTIDSLLGKLRSTFNGLGRLEQTNPITHPRIKEYLKFVREEQAGLAVTPFTSRAVFLC